MQRYSAQRASRKFKSCKPATPKNLHGGNFYGSRRAESFPTIRILGSVSLPNRGYIVLPDFSISSRRDVLMLSC